MMNTFFDKGLVREVNLKESKLRYEHISKNDHHHLLCERCGVIEDISDCGIESWKSNCTRKKDSL